MAGIIQPIAEIMKWNKRVQTTRGTNDPPAPITQSWSRFLRRAARRFSMRRQWQVSFYNGRKLTYTHLSGERYALFFTCLLYYSHNSKSISMHNEDLSRRCDACGKPIGGGYKHCPKCNIYLCWYCGYVLQNLSKEFPAKCPMCGGEFE